MLREISRPARAVAISPDARWLALGLTHRAHMDDERGLMLLDLQAPDAAPRIHDTPAGVWSLAFSPDSSQLCATTISAEGRLIILDVANGAELPPAGGHGSRVWSAAFTADSRHILTTTTARSLGAWPTGGGPPATLPLAHDNEIWTAALHPSGTLLASGDKDGVLKLNPWPLPEPAARLFPRHAHFRYARPNFTPDGSGIVVCEAGAAWRTILWHPADGTGRPLDIPAFPLDVAADGTALWLDASTGQPWKRRPGQAAEMVTLPGAPMPLPDNRHATSISPDRRRVFLIFTSGTAISIEPATGATARIDNFCQSPPLASALSPGARFLAAATTDELVVHDFGSGATTRLPAEPHWTKAVAFSPDGKRLFTGGVDGRITVRDLPALTVTATLSGHLSEVSGLAVSPDGKTLVSSEIGTGLRFWRLDTLHEVMRLPMPDVCETLVFAPDGRSLAVATCPPASPPEKGMLVVIPCGRAGDGGGQ